MSVRNLQDYFIKITPEKIADLKEKQKLAQKKYQDANKEKRSKYMKMYDKKKRLEKQLADNIIHETI